MQKGVNNCISFSMFLLDNFVFYTLSLKEHIMGWHKHLLPNNNCSWHVMYSIRVSFHLDTGTLYFNIPYFVFFGCCHLHRRNVNQSITKIIMQRWDHVPIQKRGLFFMMMIYIMNFFCLFKHTLRKVHSNWYDLRLNSKILLTIRWKSIVGKEPTNHSSLFLWMTS